MIINKTRFRSLQNEPEINRAKELFRSGDRVGAARILCKYDIVDPRKNTRQRRSAQIERLREDQLFANYERAKLINLMRDAERNASNARGMLLQIRLNTASGIKARFNSDDDAFNKAAAFWFNTIFSHDCGFADDECLSDIAENIVAARFREGDCLVVWDPLREDSPVVKVYEADQMPDIDSNELKKLSVIYPWIDPESDTCELGIICDQFGRVKGYAATYQHGAITAKSDEVSCFQRNTEAKLMKKKWRFDQYRGAPDMAASYSDIEDVHEMREKEKQSAKLAASLAVVSESQSEQDAIADAAESADFANLFSDNSSSHAEPGVEDIVREDMEDDWQNFGDLSGAFVKHASPGEKITALDIDRPNLNTETFYKSVTTSAGAAIGLGKCYATGEVSTSYTAFRGEIVMTWAHFYAVQKWLERQFLDWIAVKAVFHAVSQKLVTPSSDPLWMHKISWKFPSMPAIDPEKEAKARILDVSAGFSDYADQVGPEWENKFISLGKQKQVAENNSLNLAPFEATPGAQNTTSTTPSEDTQNV